MRSQLNAINRKQTGRYALMGVGSHVILLQKMLVSACA